MMVFAGSVTSSGHVVFQRESSSLFSAKKRGHSTHSCGITLIIRACTDSSKNVVGMMPCFFFFLEPNYATCSASNFSEE